MLCIEKLMDKIVHHSLLMWYQETTLKKINYKNIKELLLRNYRQNSTTLKNQCGVITVGRITAQDEDLYWDIIVRKSTVEEM
jgi:hypothetical protein